MIRGEAGERSYQALGGPPLDLVVGKFTKIFYFILVFLFFQFCTASRFIGSLFFFFFFCFFFF